MKRLLKEYTEKKVCGVYLKSKLLGVADSCENEDDAMGFRQSAEEIDESKQYVEHITWEYFEGESNQNVGNS